MLCVERWSGAVKVWVVERCEVRSPKGLKVGCIWEIACRPILCLPPTRLQPRKRPHNSLALYIHLRLDLVFFSTSLSSTTRL